MEVGETCISKFEVANLLKLQKLSLVALLILGLR